MPVATAPPQLPWLTFALLLLPFCSIVDVNDPAASWEVLPPAGNENMSIGEREEWHRECHIACASARRVRVLLRDGFVVVAILRRPRRIFCAAG